MNADAKRKVRLDPRTFDHFPEDLTCPICGTNDDGTTVLVKIFGTTEGGIAEAALMHLRCAVVENWHADAGLGVAWRHDIK